LQGSNSTPWVVGADEAEQTVALNGDVAPLEDSPSPSNDLIGGNFLISAIANSGRDSPAVAWNAIANEYLIVWVQDNPNSSRAIYGRRVTANGTLLGGDLAIATPGSYAWPPTIAWNSEANEFLVIWSDERSGSSFDIYGQRIGANGALLGNNFAIAVAANDQLEPSVAWIAVSNQYLIVWMDMRSDSHGDINGQLVHGNGALLRGNFAISSESNRIEVLPRAVWNAAADEFLVAWIDLHGGYFLYGRRLTVNGTPLGGGLALNAITNQQWEPALVWSTANQYMIVWEDYRNSPSCGIHGQRIGNTGVLAGSDLLVGTAASQAARPDLAWNAGSNEYLVVWADSRSGLVRIYGQRIGASGTLYNDNFLINTAGDYSVSPAVGWNATANQYLVVWSDTRSGQFGIYGQRIAGIAPGPTSTPTRTPTTTPTRTPTRAPTSTPTPTPVANYVPLILQRWHPLPYTPVLGPMTPPDANPSYTVRWSPANWATSYILERATNAIFGDATQVYAGAGTSITTPSQGIARYYYRVKARNQWGDSTWSNVESVEVRWEQEPNYPLAQANGPLRSGIDFYGYPNDTYDYFFFQASSSGQVTVDLANHTGLGLQLVLRTSNGSQVAYDYSPPYHLVATVDPGRYYVQLYAIGNFNTTEPYTLRSSFP
jgi:hypothetical protein